MAAAHIGAVCMGITVIAASTLAARAEYPERPVQIIVGFAAGSAPDLIVRSLSPAMSRELGQPVLVIDQPGASGEIGAVALKNAKADGYAIGFLAVSNMAILPNTRSVQYTTDNFDYVCQTYTAPVTVVVARNSPFKTIGDLLGYARENPQKLLYGSTGPGTLTHISMAALLQIQNVKATHVPMQSLTAVVQAITGGQIAALAENVLVTRTGNLRPLVVLAKERSRLLPDVPSAGESNIAYEASAWSGLAAPKGIPAATRVKLERACRAAVSDAGFVQTADKLAIEPFYRSGDEFGVYVRSELARYKGLLPRLGLRPGSGAGAP